MVALFCGRKSLDIILKMKFCRLFFPRENSTLHDQLTTITQQMTSLQKSLRETGGANESVSSTGEVDTSLNISMSEEDSARSTDQLMKVRSLDV